MLFINSLPTGNQPVDHRKLLIRIKKKMRIAIWLIHFFDELLIPLFQKERHSLGSDFGEQCGLKRESWTK